MRVKLMGFEREEYTNRQTGEMGVSHRVQIHDGRAVRTVQIPEEKATRFQQAGLQPFADVDLSFEFSAGNFGRHFVTIADMRPAREAAKVA